MDILNYMEDGADPQSQATLAALKHVLGPGIEESYDRALGRYGEYTAEIKVARWHGGRKRGYIVWMRDPIGRQINMVFGEHEVADEIVVHVFEGMSIDPFTPATLPEGVEVNKANDDFAAKYGDVYAAANFMHDTLVDFWLRGMEDAA